MKSIGIHTIVSNNYGNRLQNYALQTVLQRICGKKYKIKTIPTYQHSMVRKCKNIIKNLIRADKERAFRAFDKKINWGESTIAEDNHSHLYPTDLLGVEKEYDAVVIGSDQIWNITFDVIGFNNFLPNILSGKKISYAASFGIKEMPQDIVKQVSKYLKDISYVSVREEAGAQLYNRLTDRDAEVVLDPTLLLSKSEWMTVTKKPDMRVPDKYIFAYFLGEDSYNEQIQEYARQYGCEIVDVNRGDIPVGPAEFLWLISNSEMVCTDSFHASIFSIIFKRPFIVFERKSKLLEMSSRLETLCGMLKLEHHRFSAPEFNFDLAVNDDYAMASSILQKEKIKSIQWLKNALSKVLESELL